MLLAYQEIKNLCADDDKPLVFPCLEKTIFEGKSFGLSCAGYDLRIHQDITLYPISLSSLLINAIPYPVADMLSIPYRKWFTLASTVEKMHIPNDVIGVLHDKSTWVRHGLTVQNTVIEPGWRGYLTLELKNEGHKILHIKAGSPIAQVLFYPLTSATEKPYIGKYQDQPNKPVEPVHEK
jgi:dCTP deaminase